MKELRIKDICDKGSSNLKQKDVEGKNGLYPVYGASGIISHIDTYHQEANYIAIVKDGSGIGRVTFMPAKSSVIGTMQYILPKDGFNINYIGYCLQSLDLSKYKQGAAIPHIYFRDYGERVVKVTEDINEQQSIVDYLDSAFAKIDVMKVNAEKRLNEAKSLFQASLKKMLEPKEGWEEKTMDDVCVLSQGLAINSKTKHLLVEKSSIPLLRIKDMKDGTREVFVDDVNYPPKCLAHPDELIYTRTGTLGLIFTGMFGIVHNNCFKIKLDEKILNKYYYMYFVGSDNFRNMILSIASRAAQPDITHKLFKVQKIQFPPLSEQQSIVETLDSLKSKVDRLQANYEKISQECDALKQAILRQVFE